MTCIRLMKMQLCFKVSVCMRDPYLKNKNQGNQPFSRKKVSQAWENFIDGDGKINEIAVRNLITSSWDRCLTEGVNPEQMAAPLLASEGALHQKRHKHSSLIECARPVLEQSKYMLQDLETVVFLADHEGVNLQVVGDPRTLYEANEIGLVPGSGWDEVISGSNAVGTAIATGKPTQVHGEEHFCKGFKPWTCTASTIRDPYDNQLIGVIDLSGLSNEFNRFHVPLVLSWASEIHLNLSKMALEQWQFIQQHSNKNFTTYSNCEKLLLDNSGRLISYSDNVRPVLKSLGIDFDPVSKRRLSLEGFGGEEIIYPHDDGSWISGDWVEPIKHNGEILGFQVLIPAGKRGTSKSRTSQGTDASEKSKSILDPFSGIYSKTASFEASVEKARTAADTPLPVLLLGDTGVGKEVFSKAIHESSKYAKGAFIDLNCGGFNKDILSSELFGHVEGAFTGAKKGGMKGKIEAANGGTLFLDEIGEMPLEVQPIFLRVLQDRKIYRMGDIKPISVDFRLIAATNRDLRQDVEEGRFRKDLYFRLSTVAITLEPLSNRKEDIEGIALLVVNRIRKAHSVTPKYLAPSLISALKDLEWPGNIRELVNVIEYMCFMSQNETLTVDDFPDEYKAGHIMSNIDHGLTTTDQTSNSLDGAEQQVIMNALEQSKGNMTQAAKILGIAKSTLYQKVKKYGLAKVT